MIITNISTYAQININNKNNEHGIKFQDENEPNWNIGYNWIYKGEIHISRSLNFNLKMNEACIVVLKKEDGIYNLHLGGDITGSIDVPNTPFSFIIQKVSGNVLLKESNLGLEQAELILSGTIKINTIKYSAEASFKILSSETRNFISFPLFIGKSWIIPGCDISIEFKLKVLGFQLPPNNFDYIAFETNRTCLSYEEITSIGNSYRAYKISSGKSSYIYYAPDIGNIVLIESEEKPIFELIATNYPSVYNPLKPEKPTGPSNVKVNVKYTYSTKTLDPDQDQIKYGWDWDGDMIADEWTKYYNSDEFVSINHTFTEEGAYNIGVKARDLSGHESQWSDSLSINIPRIYTHSKLNFNLIIKEFFNFLN